MARQAIAVSAVVAVAAYLVASSALTAGAFESKLTNAEIRTAENAGLELARKHDGFPVSQYAILARPDALSLVPGEGSVDAIIVGTPYERVSYASYLAAFQDQTPSVTDLQSAATPYTVDFIVVAHSAGHGAGEQSFLTRFSGPTLDVPGIGRLKPISKTVFGPTLDFYNLPNERRVPRWLGYDSYRFDLRELPGRTVDISRLKAILRISDPYGRRYSEPVDLSRLR
jgi:hypothetical protein